MKGEQVLGYGIEIVLVEVHCGHQGPGLEVRRVVDEGAEILCVIGNCPGGDSVAAADVRKVGTDCAVRRGAGDGMAVDTRVGFEDRAPGSSSRSLQCSLLLFFDPG